MMRNLGRAIGTAAIETFFTHRNHHAGGLVAPAGHTQSLADLQQYFISHGLPDPAGAMTAGSRSVPGFGMRSSPATVTGAPVMSPVRNWAVLSVTVWIG
jgi:hypothetical protein